MTIERGLRKLCKIMWINAGSIYVLRNANIHSKSLTKPESDGGRRDRDMVII